MTPAKTGRVSRWVVAVGIAGTVLLAMGAFSLSFTSLSHLALNSGIDPVQVWEWPLIVDGIIVVATISVVALRGGRGTGYAWTLLLGGASVSITCNALQAFRLHTQESPWMAAFVATIPPVVLLAATHMTVILTRPAETPTAPQQAPAPDAIPRRDAVGEISLDRVLEMDDDGKPDEPGPTVAKTGEDGGGDDPRTSRVAKAQGLRRDGWTISEIADELGISTGSVRRWLKPSPIGPETGDITHE